MFEHLPLEDFQARTGMSRKEFAHTWDGAKCIVSLRDLVRIYDVKAMPVRYLQMLLYSVGLVGDSDEKPYKGCGIELVQVDPKTLVVPQTFVQRSKYQGLVEQFTDIFSGFFITPGVANMNPYIILGETADGVTAIAHYLPPILEEHKGVRHLHLLDGMHRNYFLRSAGATLVSIVVREVRSPYPCDPQPWTAVVPMDDKPPKEQRFFKLVPPLFRDVKMIGIDG